MYDFLVVNSHHQEGIVFFPLLPGSVAAAALHSHRREALLLHGCDEGWNKLDREVDKKIVDGQRLVSILHSSHEGHDDSLHKGECIYILFTRLLMLGQGCLCCACTLAPVLIIVGAAPGDKSEKAVLPKEGVCIER